MNPEYMLAHAFNHIARLDRETYDFLASNPWEQGIERHGSEEIVFIEGKKDLPPHLHGVMFDAIMCLRASLDHMVYALTFGLYHQGLAPNVKLESNSTSFHFGRTLEKLEANLAKSKLPSEVTDLILEAKPYREGDFALWAMDEMARRQKHRFNVLMLHSFASQNIKCAVKPKPGVTPNPGRLPRINILNQAPGVGERIVVVRVPDGYEVEDTITLEPVVSVTLPYAGPADDSEKPIDDFMGPQPVVPFLRSVKSSIENAYSKFKETGKRLGIYGPSN